MMALGHHGDPETCLMTEVAVVFSIFMAFEATLMRGSLQLEDIFIGFYLFVAFLATDLLVDGMTFVVNKNGHSGAKLSLDIFAFLSEIPFE